MSTSTKDGYETTEAFAESLQKSTADALGLRVTEFTFSDKVKNLRKVKKGKKFPLGNLAYLFA